MNAQRNTVSTQHLNYISVNEGHTYQLELEGAKFYEHNFVPMIFRNWAEVLLDRADLSKPERLLDVACWTGIIARQAILKGIKAANLTGLDVNPGMIKIAKEIAPEINWLQGSVEEIPSEDNIFDKVVCQFGFMFFPNKVRALNEMLRVKRTNGKILLGIWNTIEENEGYPDLFRIVKEFGNSKLAEILKSPFKLGSKTEISNIIKQSNIRNYEIETVSAEVQFPSIKYWIDCDVRASPIAKTISKEQYELILTKGQGDLSKYADNSGIVKFNMSAHLISLF